MPFPTVLALLSKSDVKARVQQKVKLLVNCADAEARKKTILAFTIGQLF